MGNEVMTPDGRIDETQSGKTVDKAEEKVIPHLDIAKEEQHQEVEEQHIEEQHEEKKEEVSLDDFISEKHDLPAPKEEKKEEGEEVDEVETKSGKEQTVTTKKYPATRDYSDLPKEIVPLFSRMSNDAFAHFKPAYLDYLKQKDAIKAKDTEIENLKKGALPDSYYDNPKSVVLMPEFETINNALDQSFSVASHWKQQLIKVRKGGNKYLALDKNEKGQFITTEVPVTDDTETELQEALTFANNQVAKFQGKMESLLESHKTKVSEAATSLKDYMAKVFPVFDHPEKGKELAPLVADTIKTFHPVYRNNPLAPILARALISYRKVGELAQTLMKQGTNGKAASKKESIADDKRKAGPTSGEIGGAGKGKTKGEDITMDDFEAEKV